MTLSLVEQYPATVVLKLAGIADLPTPVTGLASVVSALAGETGKMPMRSLFVKRDDQTSYAYGGNKVRKLDFLLGDALAHNAKAVLTFGAYGSNHALATAVHARRLGLEPHVVLSPQEPGPYAPATLLAHAKLCTALHLAAGWDGGHVAEQVARELEERDGVAPYVIPMGGSNALGCIGYVNAAFEIVDQVKGVSLGPVQIPLSDFRQPDVVYTAAGTLATSVGLAIGFAAAGVPTRTVAVRVTPCEVANTRVAQTLAAETIAQLHVIDPGFPELDWHELAFELREDWFEPGYGVVTPETEAAVRQAGDARIKLETTYTAKSFAAMLADARDGRLEGQRVLFLDSYSSAPMPEPGDVEALPQVLQDYIGECERIYGATL